MTDFAGIDDDDFLVSPCILEQRRTGVIEPLSVRGLCGIVEEAPRELAVLGIEVTPEAIVRRVRAELERGVGWGQYVQPSAENFQAALAEERLDDFCLAFQKLYGNGSIFREPMAKPEIRAFIDAYEIEMPVFGEDLYRSARLRLN
ncbi:hypothetical protein [Chenggangzhangella methanolivorans]|uniref:Uncharacterized protein n=1 Tax=Chenggangzhangella methanolivorans TaxID=1437009 RepID=A0A9E6RD21_9HYPH|nr:hypothetical protein [Chenggangzhangella methanolivorans]QZO01059.1 hypothetical protein K6K41_05585 [Chenggangzhangella methanolivorans]